MTRSASLLATACLLAALPCAAQQLNDPANLAGERVSPQALADDLPINHGAPALQQLLLKLRTRASMMFIVAHPDDEDGGMLTYESRGQGARVAMLTLTRGEGGQNLMSADFDDALGLIRTQELLAEDRYTGVDQFFGTEVDFGFSKTKEETLAKWTHDRVLYDAVRCVRLYRPLVIASTFVGGPTDGHGHHQVAGEIAQEVFVAAADPKVFPEMGLAPWAPLKVYARVPFSRVSGQGMFDYATGKTIPVLFHNYVTGADSHSPPVATVLIHEGDPAVVFGKPALGMDGLTYVQFARKGLALQKTQIGPGVRQAPPGRSDSGYTLMGSRLGKEASQGKLSSSPQKPSSSPEKLSSSPQKLSSSPRKLSSFAEGGGSASVIPASNLPAEESSIFEGIDTTLPAIADLAPHAPASLRASLAAIDNRLAKAQQLFDPANPAATAPPLREALKLVDTLIADTITAAFSQPEKANLLHELRVKRVQLNNATVLALGIELNSTAEAMPNTINVATQPSVLVGPLAFSPGGLAHVRSMLNQPLGDLVIQTETGRGMVRGGPGPDPTSFDSTFVLSPALPPTRPYFDRPNLEQPFYNVQDPALRNAPSAPSPLTSILTFKSDGVRLEMRSIPSTNYGMKPPAMLPAPLEPPVIVPAVGVGVDHLKIVPIHPGAGQAALTFSAGVSANVGSALGQLHLHLPPEWSVTAFSPFLGQPGGLVPGQQAGAHPAQSSQVPPQADFALAGAGQSRSYEVQIRPGPLAANTVYPLTAWATTATNRYEGRFQRAGYFGLPHTTYSVPALLKVVAVDVTTATNLRIGYLPGTGDDVPAYLSNLGVTPVILSPKDLTFEFLKKYDAIILGVRAYAAHPELAHAGSQPLNDFAAAGGVVIVQYNSGGDATGTAPYPYDIPGDSAHNVVVEAQPVTILEPNAPLLTWPNQITSADFHSWVAEYGHGFASTWAPQYQTLLEVHDPDQDPQKGGLLVAHVGKGAYIYCALALYRQLPEGVPGAYRLFANLLSYAKNPNRPR